jgi:hypothetical protein
MLAFFSNVSGFEYGQAIYLFSFIYLPLMTLVIGVNHFDLTKELSSTKLWKLRAIRTVLVGLVLFSLLRATLTERYRLVIYMLEARGVRIPCRAAGLRLVHLWLPVIVSTVVSDSLERYRLFEQMNLNLLSLRPFSQPISVAAGDIVLATLAVSIFFTLVIIV